MKFLLILSLTILTSCTHQSDIEDKNISKNSFAEGNIEATVRRSQVKQDVCFNIAMTLKKVDQKIALPSNWTLAWLDQKERYHLLGHRQRDPSSLPSGDHHLWKTRFYSCIPKIEVNQIKSLILTPKELPFKETEGMKFQWE